MLGCTYTIGTSVLLRGKTLAEVDPNKFILYSYLRWDWWANILFKYYFMYLEKNVFI